MKAIAVTPGKPDGLHARDMPKPSPTDLPDGKHGLEVLKEYIHTAVGVVGVSAGPFGGARVIQHLRPLMESLGSC